MSNLTEKKHFKRMYELENIEFDELLKLMKKCWDIVDHKHTNNSLLISNLQNEISDAEMRTKTKDLRGNDNDKISN